MTTKPTKSRAPKTGRVGYEQTFKPAVRKRRLAGHNVKEVTPEAALTVKAGEWLRGLREAANISLTDAVTLLGISKPYLSMTEHGKKHLSPQYFEAYAVALGVPPRDFVKKLLSFYAPEIYEILLKDEDASADSASNEPQSPNV